MLVSQSLLLSSELVSVFDSTSSESENSPSELVDWEIVECISHSTDLCSEKYQFPSFSNSLFVYENYLHHRGRHCRTWAMRQQSGSRFPFTSASKNNFSGRHISQGPDWESPCLSPYPLLVLWVAYQTRFVERKLAKSIFDANTTKWILQRLPLNKQGAEMFVYLVSISQCVIVGSIFDANQQNKTRLVNLFYSRDVITIAK